MRILVDIGHPAHVHYFKQFARIMIMKGHSLYFTVRDKESAVNLMDTLDFPYYNRGKGGKNILSKLLQLPFIDAKIIKEALKFRPDLFLSFASPYAAHAAAVLRKPHIAFDDTEHAVWAHSLYRPFSDVVLSPSCYLGEVSDKQILFDSYMELSYLHPKYFKPDLHIRQQLGLENDERFIVIRLVSWDANHDVGQKGFTERSKYELVTTLSKNHKVFISSEGELPEELEKYQLKLDPSKFHDVLHAADLYIGEGSTTATECAVLGTPAIYVNSLVVGYCFELEKKYGLVFQINKLESVLDKAKEILENSGSKNYFIRKKNQMLRDKIDPTDYMVWFVEHWPQSAKLPENGMLNGDNIGM